MEIRTLLPIVDEDVAVSLEQIPSDGLEERTFTTSYPADDTDKLSFGDFYTQIGETEAFFS